MVNIWTSWWDGMPLWYQTVRSSLLLLQAALGTLLFGYSLKRRKHYGLRIALGLLVGWFVCYGIGILVYVPGSTPAALVSHVLVSVTAYACLIALVYFCCDETIWTALFAAASGYAAQDIAGSVKQILRQIPAIQLAAQDNFGVLGVDLLCYGSVFVLLFYFFRPYTRSRTENFDDKLKAVFSAVVMLICIGMARMTQDNPERNATAAIAESIYAILVDAMILGLQFGVMERAKLEGHVELMRELISQQREQMESRKESMQLVNEKYHDLKHLLQSFQGKLPEGELVKLEKSIDSYDRRVDSGSDVLDVLLAEKLEICAQRGIALTCGFGGTDFGFLDELDLYALMHNALNNAINAASALPEGRERFISLSTSREGNMLTIHVENPCAGKIDFEDGLPQTHGDPTCHGFGMRSMDRTVRKYGGMLAAKQEGEMFYLDILLIAPD